VFGGHEAAGAQETERRLDGLDPEREGPRVNRE